MRDKLLRHRLIASGRLVPAKQYKTLWMDDWAVAQVELEMHLAYDEIAEEERPALEEELARLTRTPLQEAA